MIAAIEGIDASGKQTQARLLVERAERAGLRVATLSFPRYGETHHAPMIEAYLGGRLGSLETVHPALAALLFAGERLESRPLVERLAGDSDLLVIDRYVASNLAHQGARLAAAERADLVRWLERLEYEVHGLPRPDLTIYLDMPVELATRLISERGPAAGRGDIHEEDGGYLARTAETYDWLAGAADAGTWARVACADEAGELLPAAAIAEAVWSALAPRLPIDRPALGVQETPNPGRLPD